MTADTIPRWYYKAKEDTPEAQRNADSLYYARFKCVPGKPKVQELSDGVMFIHPLPGDTFPTTEFEVIEVSSSEDVQLEMF